MVKILDGKKAAALVLRRLKRSIGSRTIRLVIVQVGHRPDSAIYIRQKIRAAEQIGVQADVISLSTQTSQTKLIRTLEKLNADTSVHGILLQLPLPSHLDAHRIVECVSPNKDVDGFHSATRVTSPLILSLLHLQRMAKPVHYGLAIILGSPSIFSHELTDHLQKLGYAVEQHQASNSIPTATKKANLVISVRGRGPKIFARHIKKGAIVLDAGIRTFEHHTTGDADLSVQSVASAVSPVPGGVGPLTVAYALSNLVRLAKKKDMRSQKATAHV